MTVDDRIERMIADPATYFAKAREQARKMILRDIERSMQRRRAAAPWWKRWLM